MIERGSDGSTLLQTFQGASFFWKISEYQYFAVCCPEISSCATKPLYLQCKLVKPQCLCQVSLGLKEVQMGAHDFKLYNMPFFARKPVNFNVSRSAAPTLDLVPASCYMTDVKQSNLKVCAMFH